MPYCTPSRAGVMRAEGFRDMTIAQKIVTVTIGAPLTAISMAIAGTAVLVALSVAFVASTIYNLYIDFEDWLVEKLTTKSTKGKETCLDLDEKSKSEMIATSHPLTLNRSCLSVKESARLEGVTRYAANTTSAQALIIAYIIIRTRPACDYDSKPCQETKIVIGSENG